MRQELIDLLRGELTPEEQRALEARLAEDASLARELEELRSLFALMRRGEEIEPAPEIRAALKAAAERATTPSLVQQLRALPGLIRYRFRRSIAFRVAAASLCAHLILMAVLFQVTISVKRHAGSGKTPIVKVKEAEAPLLPPAPDYVASLKARRLPHAIQLRRVGILGQEEAIGAGLDSLLARQRRDGSFGDAAETAYAALALMAEGDCSAVETHRGRAVRAAVGQLLRQAFDGQVHGAMLTALVEDWALSHDELSELERQEYERAILRLIRGVGTDEAAQEGLATALAAGISIPSGRDLGPMAALVDRDREALEELVSRPATRLAATVVLARGQPEIDLERVRAWLRPLFERAKAEIEGRNASSLAVLTLQAPYRL